MNIEDLSKELSSVAIQNETELEQFRIRFLGSKNILKDLYAALKDIPNDQKRAYGQQVNELKQKAEEIYAAAKAAFTVAQNQSQKEDLSKPASDPGVGSHHPLSLIRREIVEIFNRIGFVVSEGPEIEDDWHNFSALNFPPEHPARDMQDTFFIEKANKNGRCVPTPAVCRYASWNTKNHLSALFHQGVFTETKPFLRVHIVSFIRWKACTSIKMSLLQTSNKRFCFLPKNFSENKQKFASDHLISLLLSQAQKLTSPALCVLVKVAMSVNIQAGLKSWVAAWLTRMYSMLAALIQKHTVALPSAWALSALRSSNIASPISDSILKTTSVFSNNLLLVYHELAASN